MKNRLKVLRAERNWSQADLAEKSLAAAGEPIKAGKSPELDRLRLQGEAVVCMLPGHGHEGQEFDCDRELVHVAGEWVVRAL